MRGENGKKKKKVRYMYHDLLEDKNHSNRPQQLITLLRSTTSSTEMVRTVLLPSCDQALSSLKQPILCPLSSQLKM